MNHLAYIRNYAYITAISLLITNCNGSSDNAAGLLIAAGSNLRYSLGEIAENFEKEHNYPITFVWGSTGSLMNQIRYGAPYDIFIAADRSFIEPLRDEGLVDNDSAVFFASGQIAVGIRDILVKNRPVVTLEDLTDPELSNIVIASPEHAPFGIAAKEALIRSGLWQRLEPKLIYAENIRQCMQFIMTGNADAGIVSFNIPAVEGVAVFPVDPGLYTAPMQTGAVLKTSRKKNIAARFLRYLGEQKAVEILNKYNYITTH